MTLLFQKGAQGNQLSYPLTESSLSQLTPSALVSPLVGVAHLADWPAGSGTQADLDEVIAVRLQVQRGEMPWEFLDKYWTEPEPLRQQTPAPLGLSGLSYTNPEGLAHAVHMDTPLDLPLACLRWLLRQGAPLAITPPHTGQPFLTRVSGTIAQMSHAIDQALELAFASKWHFGHARPEELYAERLDLTPDHALHLTAYPEGCPCHPTYPAGHGAAAGAGVGVLLRRFTLTPDQAQTLRETAYIWAMSRTFAGVHFGVDNIAGLQLGYDVAFDSHTDKSSPETLTAPPANS